MRLGIRMTVTQQRILLLVANLLLALGVPAVAAYNYYRKYELTETATLVPLEKFGPRDVAIPDPNPGGKVAVVADWIDPPEPPATDPNKGSPGVTTSPDGGTVSPDEGNLAPGPLDERWVYAFHIIGEDPLENFVILKKKDAPGARLTPNIRGRSPPPRAAGTSPSGRTPARPRPVVAPMGPKDRISLSVRDREFKDEELGEHFYIHAADREKFVYWMPENPKIKYALKYTTESRYLEDPSDGLLPREDEAQKSEEEKEKDKAKKLIFRSPDWESVREKDYQDLLEGKVQPPKDEPKSGTRTIGAPKSSGPPSAGSSKQATAEQWKQLNDAMKNAPPEAQKQFREGLQGGAANKR